MLEAHYIIAALPDQYGSEMKFADFKKSRARQAYMSLEPAMMTAFDIQ